MPKHNFDTVEEFWTEDELYKSNELAKHDSVQRFERRLSQFIGCLDIRTVPSARWGLQWILQNMPAKGYKILCLAFNCSVLETSIINSGYKLKLFDFYKSPGRFDWSKILNQLDNNCAAIIIPHLFGVPTDFREIIAECRNNGTVIIEDCAHTLGGYIENQHVGTLGDAAIFSFNYDKPISLGWGGALCINNDKLFKLPKELSFTVPDKEEEMANMLKFIRSMQIRRQNISKSNTISKKILRRLKLLRNHNFSFALDQSIGPLRAELGILALERYVDILNKRIQNAKFLKGEAKNYFTWPVTGEVKPAWLKQKVCLTDMEAGLKVSQRLQKLGYRVGNFNWPKMLQGEGAHNCPISKQAANFWLDVPVHQNMNQKDLQNLAHHLNVD